MSDWSKTAIGVGGSFAFFKGALTETTTHQFANRNIQQSATGARRFSFYGTPQALKDYEVTFRAAGKECAQLEMALMHATYNVHALNQYKPLSILPAGALTENILPERESMMLNAAISGKCVLKPAEHDEDDNTYFYKDMYECAPGVTLIDEAPLPYERIEYNFSAVLDPGAALKIRLHQSDNKIVDYTFERPSTDGIFPARRDIWFTPSTRVRAVSVFTAKAGGIGYLAMVPGKVRKFWAPGRMITNVALVDLSKTRLRGGVSEQSSIYEYKCKFIEVGTGNQKVV